MEKKPIKEIKDDEGNNNPNPQYQLWINNDKFLISWLLGTTKEDVLSIIFSVKTTYEVWTSLKKQLLPIIVKKNIKNMLTTFKKRPQFLEEYLRDCKNICNNLVTIKKSTLDQDKVFQFAYGLGHSHIILHLASLC